jgi:hypothetical protein
LLFRRVVRLPMRKLEVDPRGLEPLTSAMRGRSRGVQGVSGHFKISLSKPASRISLFRLFTGVCPGHCQITVKVLSWLEKRPQRAKLARVITSLSEREASGRGFSASRTSGPSRTGPPRRACQGRSGHSRAHDNRLRGYSDADLCEMPHTDLREVPFRALERTKRERGLGLLIRRAVSNKFALSMFYSATFFGSARTVIGST